MGDAEPAVPTSISVLEPVAGRPVTVTVFDTTFSELAVGPTPAAAMLSADEHRRAAAFATDSLRRRYELGRTFLRTCLGAVVGIGPERIELTQECRWCGAAHGKPRLAARVPSPSFSFNLSHAEDRLVLAMCIDAEVGVDVESRWGVGLHLAEQIIGDDPAPSLPDRYDDRAHRAWLTHVWTVKEAVLKCTGHGLAVDPRRVRHTDVGAESGSASFSADDRDWTFGWRRLHEDAATTSVVAIIAAPGT